MQATAAAPPTDVSPKLPECPPGAYLHMIRASPPGEVPPKLPPASFLHCAQAEAQACIDAG
eukprot:11278210-Alexandrium_andersonii.AAC.1